MFRVTDTKMNDRIQPDCVCVKGEWVLMGTDWKQKRRKKGYIDASRADEEGTCREK